MSGPPGHGNVPPSIQSLSSQAPSQASWVLTFSVPNSVRTSAAESSHLSRSSVSSVPPQLPTLPPREAIDQGRAWVQPLKAVVFFPSDTRTLDPPFQLLSKGETKDLFHPKGFLDPNRRVYLIKGRHYKLTCFCTSLDVECEPKDDIYSIMFECRLSPGSRSRYICYTCKTCGGKWVMNMPTSQEDLASLQTALRSAMGWETIRAEMPASSDHDPVLLWNVDAHAFICPIELGGCGSENVKCRRIFIEDKHKSDKHKNKSCKDKDGTDKDKDKPTPFVRYTCRECKIFWVTPEPFTRAAWDRWKELRDKRKETYG